ncbi:MAG: hypothetical protein QNJ13_07595 [Paracoccaceae bacterium]|nr:hypothetical protein [Paracoccaceae bacterium]
MLIALLLAACGPISPEEAANRCEDRARNAAGPTGEATLGVGSSGGDVDVIAGLELTVTGDFIAGRDPQTVYENCVFNLTGQGPVRPLRL